MERFDLMFDFESDKLAELLMRIDELEKQLREEKKQKDDIQTKYDKLIGKLQKKKITEEHKKIINMFHPVRLDNPSRKYTLDDLNLDEY